MEWVAFIFVGMVIGAWNSKALAPTVMYGLGLEMVYPDVEMALLLVVCLVAASFLAGFRP